MKKKISLLLILTLLITVLSACAASNKEIGTDDNLQEQVKDDSNNDEKIEEDTDNENETNTLTVQVEKEWKGYYTDAVNRVKETYPDANIVFIEKETDEHLKLLSKTNLADGNVADLFTISLDKVNSLKEKEVLGELDARSIAENLGGFDDYDSSLGGAFKVDERYLAFPMNIEALVNFVNIKNAETNDIDYVKEIEFVELSNEDILMPIFDLDYGITFMNAGNIHLLANTELEEYSSDMTREFSQLNANQQEIFKALFNYWYYSEEKSLLFNEDEYLSFMDSSFKTDGNTFIRPGKTIDKNNLLKLVGEENLDVLPMQQLVVMGNVLSQWKDGDGLSINARIKDSKAKMDIAEAMIEEIVNPKYAIDFFNATGKVLTNVVLDEYMESDLKDIDKKMVETTFLSYEKAVDRPTSLEIEKVSDTWRKAILSWNTLKPGTAEDAYEILQDEFKSMLDNIK